LAQEEIKFWVILCLHKLSKGTIWKSKGIQHLPLQRI
jgi:hypothetical protein